MKKKILSVLLCLSMSLPVLAAKLEGNVNKQIAPVQEQELTVGTVQKYVHVGQAQDEVAIALGSPNIVTQDENGKETWIYDKMSSSITDRDKMESSIENATAIRNSWHALGTFLTLGLINKDVKPELKDVSQVVSSQKTLTIVIKFDKTNKVESFTYHMSKF
jgi:outer membrane protein assembly factor BamE (lipoprotein component of BamABCDE complex)